MQQQIYLSELRPAFLPPSCILPGGGEAAGDARARRRAGALLQIQAEHHHCWPRSLTEVGCHRVLQDEVHNPYPEQGESVVKGCSGDTDLCCVALENKGGKGEGVHQNPGKEEGKKWGAGCGQ